MITINVRQTARIVAFLLVALLAVGALYVLTVGLPVTRFFEVPPAEPLPPGQIRYEPYPPAIYSLLAFLLVAIALLKTEWLPLAWWGVVLLLVSGGFLIFSLGFVYFTEAGVLAVPLGILHWQISGRKRWLMASWAGVGLLLLLSILLAGSSFGLYVLVACVLLGLLVAGLQWRTARQRAA